MRRMCKYIQISFFLNGSFVTALSLLEALEFFMARCPCKQQAQSNHVAPSSGPRTWAVPDALKAKRRDDDGDGLACLRKEVNDMKERINFQRIRAKSEDPRLDGSLAGSDSASETDDLRYQKSARPSSAQEPEPAVASQADLYEFEVEKAEAKASASLRDPFYVKPLGGAWTERHTDDSWDRYGCFARAGVGLRFCNNTRWPNMKTWSKRRYGVDEVKMLANEMCVRTIHYCKLWHEAGELLGWTLPVGSPEPPENIDFVDWVCTLDHTTVLFAQVMDLRNRRP